MFQQHHEESLSEAWTHFKDLLQKCEIDRTAASKLRNKNADEYWEIFENLSLYDHEGWNDVKEFVKPVKAISTPQGISKTPDQRLLELEDQINFLLKGSRLTPRISTHIPHVYTDAVYSNPRPQNYNEPPKLNPFTFCERTGPSPQPQELGTTFEARVRDYMAAHTERIGEEEMSDKTDETLDNTVKPARIEMEILVKEAKRNNETKNEPIKKAENKEMTEAPSSQPIEYYLKHSINEKLIEGLVDNHRFNESLSGARARKTKGKTYNMSPKGPIYEAILKKKITKKEDIRGNFEIPCCIGGLKHVNALVDQGSDVNIMPYSTYMKLTDERPTETDIRLSLASHSLYLMRRSLEVLRKFQWKILEGRFNQLSHVSSLLLSKPGEYYSAFGRHSRLCSQQLETESQITRDAVTIHTKTASQDLKTASECTTQPII
ncbi:hypothetical protein Tco_0223770 [Tanacetum coccineum]